MAERNTSENNVGKVVEVKGVVIDAVFTGSLPEIYNALRITVPGENGSPGLDLIAEVQQHLGTIVSVRSRWIRPTACRAAST